MLSKSKLKLITSLNQKKQREKQGLFVAEGEKLVEELVKTYSIRSLYTTNTNVDLNKYGNAEPIIIDQKEMKQISLLQSPPQLIALFEKPEINSNYEEISSGFSFVLDGVQDPGNLGTIIRLANWFDIDNIICSKTCADWFNPKVVQASMGALGRSKLIQLDLEKFLAETKLPILGTFMEGDNLYTCNLPKEGLIVLGSEGKGISEALYPFISQKITIPSFGATPVESLNVAMAAGIISSEIKRRSL